ncbi:MAG: hypothetical protein JTJ21_11435 [Holdemanella sp.]|nr:hypothetical protein [Holdemanella sp.]
MALTTILISITSLLISIYAMSYNSNVQLVKDRIRAFQKFKEYFNNWDEYKVLARVTEEDKKHNFLDIPFRFAWLTNTYSLNSLIELKGDNKGTIDKDSKIKCLSILNQADADFIEFKCYFKDCPLLVKFYSYYVELIKTEYRVLYCIKCQNDNIPKKEEDKIVSLSKGVDETYEKIQQENLINKICDEILYIPSNAYFMCKSLFKNTNIPLIALGFIIIATIASFK